VSEYLYPLYHSLRLVVKIISLVVIALIIGLLWGCSADYTPKPNGFNRIELPDHSYLPLPDTLPYVFEYSKHAQLLDDDSRISEPYWIDIHYPTMDADIQITYKPVQNNRALLEEYLKDAYTLTNKHNVKAYSIEENIAVLKSGNVASISELEGEVPTQFQFHITDSTNHFIRGALYFKTATQNDSLRPVIDYLKEDMIHLLNTLQWKEVNKIK
jgi:gliding motility-associated lipoprotein GldD